MEGTGASPRHTQWSTVHNNTNVLYMWHNVHYIILVHTRVIVVGVLTIVSVYTFYITRCRPLTFYTNSVSVYIVLLNTFRALHFN